MLLMAPSCASVSPLAMVPSNSMLTAKLPARWCSMADEKIYWQQTRRPYSPVAQYGDDRNKGRRLGEHYQGLHFFVVHMSVEGLV